MFRTARPLLLVVLVCLAGQTVAAADDAVPLAFKFAPGDVLRYDVTLSGSGGFNGPDGAVSPIGLRGTLSILQTVTEVLPDGSGRIETRVPSGEVTINLADEQVRFSYANGTVRWFANGKESSPPQGDLSKIPLIGTPVVYTMAPNGRVSDVSVADPELLGQMAQSFPGLNFAPTQSISGTVFPADPVRVGETWRDAVYLSPLGPQLPITVTVSRTLQSFDEAGGIGLARIVGFAEASYRGGAAPLAPTQDVSISIPTIRQTVTSTEFFNTTSGRLVRGDYDLAFSVAVSAKVGAEEKGGGIEARMRVHMEAR